MPPPPTLPPPPVQAPPAPPKKPAFLEESFVQAEQAPNSKEVSEDGFTRKSYVTSNQGAPQMRESEVSNSGGASSVKNLAKNMNIPIMGA